MTDGMKEKGGKSGVEALEMDYLKALGPVPPAALNGFASNVFERTTRLEASRLQKRTHLRLALGGAAAAMGAAFYLQGGEKEVLPEEGLDFAEMDLELLMELELCEELETVELLDALMEIDNG